ADPNHTGVSGVTIELYDETGNLVGSTLTNADGRYEFSSLTPGTYTVVEVQPANLLDAHESLGTVGGLAAGELLGNDRFRVELGSGDEGVNYNFCEHLPAELSGTVWHDGNDNGVLEPGEQRIGNVVIQLFDKQGNLIQETRTDADGEYEFKNLVAGEYLVKELQPNGFIDGQESLGLVDGESAGQITANDEFCVKLGYGQVGTNYDFGELRPAELSGTVWHDVNDNGVLESGEERIGNVVIQLLDKQGNLIQETRTDANGEYEFTNLAPGEYLVKEFQPDGFIDGQESLGRVNGLSSGEVTANDEFCVKLGNGERGTNYDFGELRPAELSGTVWHDANNDGVLDPGEDRVADVNIQLFDKQGNLVSETVTDANGEYKFTDLAPGEYLIREIQPGGYLDGQEALGTVSGLVAGQIEANDEFCVKLGSGDVGQRYDFGELLTAQINGRVWEDGPAFENEEGVLPDNYRDLRDGIYQEGVDTPLAGVRMNLYWFIDPQNNLQPRPVTLGEVDASEYAHMNTDDPNASVWVDTASDGQYWFRGLQPGNYIVLQDQPDGFFDSNDTEGTTTGFAFNSPQEAQVAPQSVISTFSATQIQDSIVGIQVQSGGVSLANNFSEVTVTSVTPPEPPILPPPIPPTPPTPSNPTPPGVGLTGIGGLAGSQPSSFTQLIGTSRGAAFQTQATPFMPYSWHLSVVNGGNPRASSEMAEENVWSQASFIADTDWSRFEMEDAIWSFTETTDDLEIRKTNNTLRFGMFDGTPLAGDFDGDGIDEVAVFKDGYWLIDINRNGKWDDGDLMARLGDFEDRPIVGDWDGDGKDDIGIYGPMWERDPNAIDREPGLPNPENDPYTNPKNVPPVVTEATNGARTLKLTSYGKQRADVVDHVFGMDRGDKTPVAGDWNGNGIRSIGTFDRGYWELDVNGDGRFDYDDLSASFGQEGDIPLVGDFDGDGIEEIAVYRAGTWIIDSNGNRELDATDKTFEMGDALDKPVVGDWDGDGIDEPGLYREMRKDF
ncbi:MAG: SdrD B-like domain-containing protein, partial [Planctomycetota bacterium]